MTKIDTSLSKLDYPINSKTESANVQEFWLQLKVLYICQLLAHESKQSFSVPLKCFTKYIIYLELKLLFFILPWINMVCRFPETCI